MSKNNRIKLEHLPEQYQRQAEAQMAHEPVAKPEPMPAESAPKTRAAVRSSNKTEERFRAEVLIWRGFRSIHPQAMVFAFRSGDSYRPDFVAFDDVGRMFVYEIKARGWLRDPRSKAGIQKFRRAKELHPHVCFVLAILEDTGRWTMEGQANGKT
jgi:hypothetical protein